MNESNPLKTMLYTGAAVAALLALSYLFGVRFVIADKEYGVVPAQEVGGGPGSVASVQGADSRISGNARKGWDRLMTLDVDVRQGDIVMLTLTSSAKGRFYYRLSENGQLTRSTKPPVGVIQSENWDNLSTHGLFCVEKSGNAKFEVQVNKVDIQGDYDFFRPVFSAVTVYRDTKASDCDGW
jgi:hypothetical protein